MKKALFSLVVPATIATDALAHNGHHSPGLLHNLWHLLTQPDHLVVLAALAVPVALAALWRQKRKSARTHARVH